MTPEDVISKFSLNRAQVETVFLRDKKIEYFMEHSEVSYLDKESEDCYDIYFLVTDAGFDRNKDSKQIQRELNSIKRYLYEEGFMDNCLKDVNQYANFKLHFLVRYPTSNVNEYDDSIRYIISSRLKIIFCVMLMCGIIFALLKILGII